MRALASLASLSLALAFTLAARAQPAPPAPPAIGQELRLTALGGAALKVPAWKEVRKDEAVSVLEQLPDPAQQKPFYVLMAAIEEGPADAAAIVWDKVRDNIVEAASKNGRKLELKVGDAFEGAAGFTARWLAGEFVGANGKKVALALVALVREKRLVTIGVISEEATPAAKTLAQDIAKTARLGP